MSGTMFDPNQPSIPKETWLDRAFLRLINLSSWQLFLFTVLIMILFVVLSVIINIVFRIPVHYHSWVSNFLLVFLIAVLATGFVRKLLKMFRDSLLKYVSGPDALRSMTAAGLENLCMALYESQGYKVKRRAVWNQPDGGVDLEVFKDGKRGLVQCKKWTHEHVGVDKVRELIGVVSRKQADYGVIVTTSDFTEAAEKEALNRIELIAHAKLWEMVQAARLEGVVEKEQRKSFPLESGDKRKASLKLQRKERLMCPECGSKLLLRANRNDHNLFLGCAGYRKSGCTFTVPVDDGRKRAEKMG